MSGSSPSSEPPGAGFGDGGIESVGAVPVPPGGLSVSAVAQRLGVAAATLRTWDRRYGIGPSQHSAGAHRRYSAGDLRRLEVMQALVFEGASPADAAKAALSSSVSAVSAVSATTPVVPVPVSEMTGRAGGGRVVPLHGGGPQARGLSRAALAMDAPAVRRLIVDSLTARGTIWTWDNLIVPVLIGVGEKFAATGEGIELEHLLSEGVAGALRDVAESVNEPFGSRPVVLAAAPDEQHTLPLYAVAAALAERGVASRMLGPRVPASAMALAVERSGSPALMIWAHDDITASLVDFQELHTLRSSRAIVLGGPGWGTDLPDGVRCCRDLTEAVTRLANAARGML